MAGASRGRTIVVSLATLVASCSGASPDPGPDDGVPSAALTVTAEDGSAEMIFPPGALPPGTDPDEIAVRRVPDEQLIVEGAEAALGGVWLLFPDGLELRAPATLTVRAGVPDLSGGVHLLHRHGDTVELLSGSGTYEADGTLSVSAEVSVFSEAWLLLKTMMDVEFLQPAFGAFYDDGATIPVQAEVTRTAEPLTYAYFDPKAGSRVEFQLQAISGSTWKLGPGAVLADGPVRPGSVGNLPAAGTGVTGDSFVAGTELTCNGAGQVRIVYTTPFE
ncbi:MAG: hypothetical protein HY658_09200, partial [Actinobacteria bacterium]|nr:hypothetical protein [Actinomycetota bacterium]